MIAFVLGLIVAYIITGLFSMAYPSAVAARAYSPSTRFLAWPGVAFPDSPFGAMLAWSLKATK